MSVSSKQVLEHIKKKQLLQLRTLLLHPKFEWHESSLDIFARDGHIEGLEMVLRSKKPYFLDTTPLYLAISKEHYICARILLEYGAPVGASTLRLAIKRCDYNLAHYVLKYSDKNSLACLDAQITAIRGKRINIFKDMYCHQKKLQCDAVKECYQSDLVDFTSWIVKQEQQHISMSRFTEWMKDHLYYCIKYDAVDCLRYWIESPYRLDYLSLIRSTAKNASVKCLSLLLHHNPNKKWSANECTLCSELIPLEREHLERTRAKSFKYGKVWSSLIMTRIPLAMDFAVQIDQLKQTYQIEDPCEWLVPARQMLQHYLVSQLESLLASCP